MSAMDEYRRVFGNDRPKRQTPQSPSVLRIVTPINGTLTEVTVDLQQWREVRAELARELRQLENNTMSRLFDLIDTDPEALQVDPQGVSRAIVQEIREHAQNLLDLTEGWNREPED